MSRNKRVLEVRKYLGISQKKFADSINVSIQTVNNIEKDKYDVSGDVLEKILQSYPGIDALWLVMGEGEMFRKDGKYSLNLDGRNNIGSFIAGDNAQANDYIGNDSSKSNKELMKLKQKLDKILEENESLKVQLSKAKDKIISLLEK